MGWAIGTVISEGFARGRLRPAASGRLGRQLTLDAG